METHTETFGAELTRNLPEDEAAPIADGGGFWRNLRLLLSRRRFSAKYFSQLDAEFEGLCTPEYKRSVAKEVTKLREAHADRPSWEINHRYEYVLNAGVPDTVLHQRCCMYRQRLRQLLEDCPAELHVAFDGVAKDAPPETLRSAMLGMLSEIQRLRHVRSEFERLRNRLFLVLAQLGLLFVLFFVLSPRFGFSTSVHVVMAGVLGGYFSVLLRLGAMHFRDEYNINYHQVDQVFYNVLVTFALALFEGGVAAHLLYTLFVSGVVEGAMFPAFDLSKGLHEVTDLMNAMPTTPSDTAKLLMWSVAAGFSERLVPDVLNGLAKDNAPAPKGGAQRPVPAALGGESLTSTK